MHILFLLLYQLLVRVVLCDRLTAGGTAGRMEILHGFGTDLAKSRPRFRPTGRVLDQSPSRILR